MCATCGCSGDGHKLTTFVPTGKPRNIGALQVDAGVMVQAAAGPPTIHAPEPSKTLIEVERDVLDKNNRLAERNRGYFEARNIAAFNLVSSPGSGKTSILERTLLERGTQTKFYVIEGDQQSARDAERIAAGGAPVVQVNTGKGCHLEANMVHEALRQLDPAPGSVVFIENVGNLVCPSMFDLGERKRVVVISITEGEDKPLKYPDMFRSSQLCIINKMDLLPYLKFDLDALKAFARQVNPELEFIELSATTGQGIENWYDWLDNHKTQPHPN